MSVERRQRIERMCERERAVEARIVAEPTGSPIHRRLEDGLLRSRRVRKRLEREEQKSGKASEGGVVL